MAFLIGFTGAFLGGLAGLLLLRLLWRNQEQVTPPDLTVKEKEFLLEVDRQFENLLSWNGERQTEVEDYDE